MIAYVIQVIVERIYLPSPIPKYFIDMLKSFPRDIRAATSHFNLEGKATVHAACPNCHTTYEPTYDGAIPVYQQRCNARKHGARCGELLVQPKTIRGHQIFVPIMPYVAFDFKDWVASLLSREGYERTMDGAWDGMEPDTDGILRGIFQGSVIRGLKGLDGKHFSKSGGDNAGRYLFSVGCDFFNPLRILTAGKKISIGIIAVVCVSLPIAVRYLPENMFLAGIIPGPHEPSLDLVCPYLKPLVDAFLQFWKGIFFSRTALYDLGRLVLCALITLVCDLPAARKFGGFAGFGHDYFCSMCWCNRTEQTYNNFDYSSWKRRTNDECRDHAETYRSAPNIKKAQFSFDSSGIRWTELLRLPYFDPTTFVVVDPMHNLFLGLIKEHFQGILGYQPKTKVTDAKVKAAKVKAATSEDRPVLNITIPEDPTNPPPSEKNARASVRRLISWLQQPLNFDEAKREESYATTLTQWGGPKSKVHISAFVYVGRGLGCLPSTIEPTGRDTLFPMARGLKKIDLADKVLSWVCSFPYWGVVSVLNFLHNSVQRKLSTIAIDTATP